MRNLPAVTGLVVLIPLLTLGVIGQTSDPFAQGLKLFNQGAYDQATGLFSRAVAVRPDDAVRRLTYGVALANGRRYNEAIFQFREAERLAPDDPMADFLLEGAYLGQGTTAAAQEARKAADQKLGGQFAAGQTFGLDRAVKTAGPAVRKPSLLDRALIEHPDNAIAQNLLGDLYQVQRRYAEAVVHYRSATQIAPRWIKPWFNLGMANLVVDPAQAAQNFKRVIELDPRNLQAQLWLGDAYTAQKNYPLALRAYNEAANSPALASQARSRLGNVMLKQNEPVKAEKEFVEAGKAAPQDPVPAAGRADALKQQQKLLESENEYRRAEQLSQASPTQQAAVLSKLAPLYIEKGEYKKAIDELKRVVALNPQLPDAFRKLAEAYQRGGLLQEGIAEHEAALARNPHDSNAMRFLLEAYRLSGNAQGRAQMARKLLKAVPDESAAWNKELGSALVALGDRDGALEAWRSGLESDPSVDGSEILPAAQAAGLLGELVKWYERESATRKAAAPSLILAGIYESRGEFQRAAEVRRKLARRYPDGHQNWLLLGDDLCRTGDVAEARTAYTRAAASVNATIRSAAQSRLRELKQ